jgi:hypothetical protein
MHVLQLVVFADSMLDGKQSSMLLFGGACAALGWLRIKFGFSCTPASQIARLLLVSCGEEFRAPSIKQAHPVERLHWPS